MPSRKKLALVGYGKMGKLVEQLAAEYDFDVVARLTGADKDAQVNADVAVEFSTPEAAPENLLRLARARVPTVCGTTGWFARLPEVQKTVEQNQTALVWSPNFSTGVAVFRRLTALAAELLRNEPSYGAWAWEIHHEAKKDAPSGTMLSLVETMRASGYDRPIDLAASRAGKHPGTHEIGFDSAADTITLRHSARSREGFARGALKSAQWILGKIGVFTFENVLFSESEPERK
jgi:4-hydroxy-tetrahydrodipicolinate reductase